MKNRRSAFSILKSKGAVSKLLLGGFYSVFFFTIYFAFVVTGYQMHVLCSALEGRKSKLPEWKGFGALFQEGIQPVLITLAYSSPIVGLFIMEINLATAGTIKNIYLWPFEVVLILAISAFLPMALIRSTVKASLKSAFDFKAIAKFIGDNASRYISAWALSLVVYMVAIMVCMVFLLITGFLYSRFGFPALVAGSSVAGLIACFMFFTSTIVVAHLFARAYRSSRPFADDQFGEIRASMTIPPPLHK